MKFSKPTAVISLGFYGKNYYRLHNLYILVASAEIVGRSYLLLNTCLSNEETCGKGAV